MSAPAAPAAATKPRPLWSARFAGPRADGRDSKRCRAAAFPTSSRATPGQAQFGIVQGGTHKDLRDRSIAGTVHVGFEAYAIGGLSVGEPPPVMYDIAGHTAAQLPEHAPRYLMGVGMPDDLVESVDRGIDLFDCVLPTRNARNGQLFTRHGPISIKNSQYATDAGRWTRNAPVPPAATTPGPTFGTCTWRARCPRRP